jgi:hypothetical protein
MTSQKSDTVHLCGQDIQRPGHICAFFDSRDDEYGVLLPYLKEGVDRGEKIVNVLDAARLEDHERRLRDAGMRVDLGDVSVAASEDTYLANGRFEIDRMAKFVEDTVANAKAGGCRVRTAGWMNWLDQDAPGSDRAAEYEARMNLLVPKYDCTFMCVYDLAQLGGQGIVDIISTHPWVILNGAIRKNEKFIPPEVYLDSLLSKQRTSRPVA